MAFELVRSFRRAQSFERGLGDSRHAGFPSRAQSLAKCHGPSRTRVRRNPSFPYEEIYGLTCQMPDAKSGSVDPEQRRRRQRAPRLETHILIAQRLKYMSPSACFSPCKVTRIKAAGQFDRRASLIGKSKNGAQGLSSEVRGPTSPAFHPSLQNQNRSHPIHGLRPLFNRQVRLSQQPIRFG